MKIFICDDNLSNSYVRWEHLNGALPFDFINFTFKIMVFDYFNQLWPFLFTSIKIWTLALYCKVALVIVIKSFPSFTIQEVCW